MRRIDKAFIAIAVGVLGLFAMAPDDRIVRSIDTVTNLTTHDWSNRTHLDLQGYYTYHDGGQGRLDYVSCSGKVIDSGNIFTDTAGNCFERADLNGNGRQFGLVEGSDWDCSTTGVAPSSCFDAEPRMAAMITAGMPHFITHFTTGGMNIRFSNSLTMPGNACLSSNMPGLGQTVANAKGIIMLDDGKSIIMGDSGCVRDLFIAARWAMVAPYYGAPASAEDKYAARQTMADKGDTALICDNGQCDINGIQIVGFDNCINVSGPNSVVTHFRLDCSIPLWIHDVGSNTKWSYGNLTGDLTHGEGSNLYFGISNVEDNGGLAHLCKVTVHELSDGLQDGALTDLFNGSTMWLSNFKNDTGGEGVWKRWVTTLVSPGVFTLDDSKCQLSAGKLLHHTFHATTTAGSKRLTNVDDFTDAVKHVHLSGSGIDAAATVDYTWETDGSVYMSEPATTTANNVLIQTYSALYEVSTPDCAAKGEHNPCAILSATNRYFSGNSAAGVAARHRAFGIFSGGPDPDTDKVAGLDVSHVFVYGYDVPLRAQNTEHLHTNDFNSDSVRKLADDNTGCMWLGGRYKALIITDSGCGKAGFGLLVDGGGESDDEDDNPNKGEVVLQNVHAGSYEFDGGIISGNLYGSSSFVFLGGIDQVNLTGSIDTNFEYATIADKMLTNVNLPESNNVIEYRNIWAPQMSALPDDHVVAGTGATVSGNNAFGIITIGTGNPTSLTWKMTGGTIDGGVGAPHQLICYFQNMTHPLNRIVMVSNSVHQVVANSYASDGSAAALVANDVVSYQCGTWGSR
jgi:hypothetical protein